MKLDRTAGILLHITSLPGRYGIGSLGPEAEEMAAFLAKAGMRYWQVLPIGPVEEKSGFSPYSSPSTFAGNWMFVSLERLAEEPWFPGSIGPDPFEESLMVPFPDVVRHRLPILAAAEQGFFKSASSGDKAAFERFCGDETAWLDDYALFSALAEHAGDADWTGWDRELAERDPKALAAWGKKLAAPVRFLKFLQFLFFRQWEDFREACAASGISLIGDIPIYVTMESADAWANPDILQLDEKTRRPVSVAGVPPDYFSDTGQLWGNPLYRWKKGSALSAGTLRWWGRRISHLNRLVDVIRIDHFRGFEAFWSIPDGEETAVRGTWIKGPGIQFFKKLREETGHLRLIAEDLGVITPEVEKLRDDLDLPGMRILQFAFDFNNKNYYLPHNIDNRNCVLYTGTHDNNTTNGWFYGPETGEDTRRYILEYMGLEDWSDFHWKLIRQAYRSVANLVIIPAQDILGFGPEFRMNTPGTPEGNWRFKLKEKSLNDDMALRLRRMGQIFDRLRDRG